MSPSSRTLLSTECRSLNHGDRYIRQGESGVLSLAPSHAHLLLWGPGVMPTTVPSMFLHTDSQGHMDPLNRSQKFQDSSCTLTVGDLGKSRKGRGYQGVNCREHDLEGSSIRSEHLHICISVSLAFFFGLYGFTGTPPALTRPVNHTSLVPTTSGVLIPQPCLKKVDLRWWEALDHRIR